MKAINHLGCGLCPMQVKVTGFLAKQFRMPIEPKHGISQPISWIYIAVLKRLQV